VSICTVFSPPRSPLDHKPYCFTPSRPANDWQDLIAAHFFFPWLRDSQQPRNGQNSSKKAKNRQNRPNKSLILLIF